MSGEGRLAVKLEAPLYGSAFKRLSIALCGAVRLSPEGRVLAAIVAMSMVLAACYALVTPPLAGPDEIGHLDYVQVLWDTGGDRSSWSTRPKPPNMERNSQPATYYWLVSPGYALTKGQPQDVQVAAVRLNSVLLFLVEVLLAFLVARMLSPSDPFVYLATAAIVALLPGRVWIASMINNDNLAALASAAALYFFVRWVLRDFEWKALGGLAVVAPVLLMSKVTTLPVLAVIAFAVATVTVGSLWRWGIRRNRTIAAAVTLAVVILSIATARHSWELAMLALDRLTEGGVTMLRGNWANLEHLPPTSPEPFVFQFKSFWFPVWGDDFGPPDSAYRLALGLALMAVLGLAGRLLWGLTARRGRGVAWKPVACTVILSMAAVLAWMLSIALYVMMLPQGATSFFYSEEGLDWVTHARYLFPALVPIAYLMALGLGQFVPQRFRSLGLAALIGVLLYFNAAGIFSLVSRFYWWAS